MGYNSYFCTRCQSPQCCCTKNTNTNNPTINVNPVINISPTPEPPEAPVTANNALIGLGANFTPVPFNMPIPLDTNQVINGTAISHTPPSPTIFLEPNQTYSVEYSVYGDAPTGNGLNVALYLNGEIIPFSEATNDYNFLNPETTHPMDAHGGAIFNTTGNSPNTLEVYNLASQGTTNFINFPPFYRAVSLRIINLA